MSYRGPSTRIARSRGSRHTRGLTRPASVFSAAPAARDVDALRHQQALPPHVCPGGRDFAVYMAFYPPCSRTYIDDTDVVARPIRLFHGTADDAAPLAQCLSYVKRLQAAGRDAQLTEYAGAYAGFDNPLTPVRPAGPQTTRRGCDLYEQSVGRVLNRETGVPLTRNDECLKGGGPPGYDARAHAKAVEDVKALLQRVFKLEPAR